MLTCPNPYVNRNNVRDTTGRSRRGDFCDDTDVTYVTYGSYKAGDENPQTCPKWPRYDWLDAFELRDMWKGHPGTNAMDYSRGADALYFSPQQLRRARCWLTNAPVNKEFVQGREKVKIKYSKYRDPCKGGFNDRVPAEANIYAPPCADGFIRDPQTAVSSLECRLPNPHGSACSSDFSELCKSSACKNGKCASTVASKWECYFSKPVDKSVCGIAELADVFGVDLPDAHCDSISRVSLSKNIHTFRHKSPLT